MGIVALDGDPRPAKPNGLSGPILGCRLLAAAYLSRRPSHSQWERLSLRQKPCRFNRIRYGLFCVSVVYPLVAAAPVYQLVAAGGKRVQRPPCRNRDNCAPPMRASLRPAATIRERGDAPRRSPGRGGVSRAQRSASLKAFTASAREDGRLRPYVFAGYGRVVRCRPGTVTDTAFVTVRTSGAGVAVARAAPDSGPVTR